MLVELQGHTHSLQHTQTHTLVLSLSMAAQVSIVDVLRVDDYIVSLLLLLMMLVVGDGSKDVKYR